MSARPLLILAAHGAHDGSRANTLARRIGDEVERTAGVETIAAFNLGKPSFEDAVARSARRRTLMLPLMMADAYFARTVLRRRIESEAAQVSASIEYFPPLGAWPELRELLVRIVEDHLRAGRINPVDTDVVVVGHGTERNPDSRSTTDAVVAHLQRELCLHSVLPAFIDQEPRLSASLAQASAPHVLLAPFLLGGGSHALQDIPEAVEGRTRPIHVLDPVGEHPFAPSLIADRVRRQLRGRPLRIGTRRSRLARIQAEQVRTALESAGRASRLVYVDTHGDRDQRTPLQAFRDGAPFTDDLLRALAADEIDLAMHSLKDLPLHQPAEHPLVSFLPRHDAREALVTTDGRSLAALPSGACIGTCSARRAIQLRALRPDLECLPIRGAVDDRVAQVERGDFDGAILAIAGLERLGLGDRIAQRFSISEIAPEPGQGVIAIQARADTPNIWADQIDHLPTRRVLLAELSFAREIERADPSLIVGARAEETSGGALRLWARLITKDAGAFLEASGEGASPSLLGRTLARHLLETRQPTAGAEA